MKKLLLFTIGYEKKSIEQYLEELRSNNIQVLIDIRANPISRKPGFSKQKLKSKCEFQGIEYFHFPEAGIPSFRRKELKITGRYNDLFIWYRNYLETIPETIREMLEIVNAYSAVALTCFEKDVNLCHRKLCAEHIEKLMNSKWLKVIHL